MTRNRYNEYNEWDDDTLLREDDKNWNPEINDSIEPLNDLELSQYYDESDNSRPVILNGDERDLHSYTVKNENTKSDQMNDLEPVHQRAKYSAKIDRFLNNGIMIVGVLLIAVILIAFLV